MHCQQKIIKVRIIQSEKTCKSPFVIICAFVKMLQKLLNTILQERNDRDSLQPLGLTCPHILLLLVLNNTAIFITISVYIKLHKVECTMEIFKGL